MQQFEHYVRRTFVVLALISALQASWLDQNERLVVDVCAHVQSCDNINVGDQDYLTTCEQICEPVADYSPVPDYACCQVWEQNHSCKEPTIPPTALCVCAIDAYCCERVWDQQCVMEAQMRCHLNCSTPTRMKMKVGFPPQARETCPVSNDMVPVSAYQQLPRCSAEQCSTSCQQCGVDSVLACNCNACGKCISALQGPGWAVSGGGWRAMSGGMGASRALFKLGLLDQIPVVSCNSGGSWHTAQLAFSERYVQGVTAATDDEFVAFVQAWYKSYNDNREDGFVPSSYTYKTAQLLLGADSSYTKMVGMVESNGFDWNVMITKMLQTFNGGPFPVNQVNSSPLKDKTLLINMAIPFNPIGLKLVDAVRTEYTPSNRLLSSTHVIHGLGQRPSYWTFSGKDALDLSKLSSCGFLGMSSCYDSFLVNNVNLSVEKIVAASSAAAGVLGIPGLLGQLIPIGTTTVANSFSGMAVSLDQGVKIIDGGYADNLGLASLVAFAQKQAGFVQPSSPLKFLVQDNANPGECGSALKWCFLSTSGTLSPFNLLNNKIFAESWVVVSLLFQHAPGQVVGNMGIAPSWAVMSVTTVDNPNYNVQGGWQVQLFCVILNSNSQTILAPDEDNTGYINDAINMQAAMLSLQPQLVAFFKS